MLQWGSNILSAATKTWHRQINKIKITIQKKKPWFGKLPPRKRWSQDSDQVCVTQKARFSPLHHAALSLFKRCIYFWPCWVFVAACRLSLAEVSRSCSVLRCLGLSLWWLLLLWRMGSGAAPALLPRGMRNLPGPAIEPMPPALAGRFLTTRPPGNSHMTPSCVT